MVLVTGGTGFLGAYIIKNLVEKGVAVRAIRRSDRLPFFIPADVLNKVEWVSGDVLDVFALNEAMQGIDGLIHSAALVSFSRRNRGEMYQVNIEGTANVVNVALDNHIQRMVHVSSVAALGRTLKPELVSEEKKWAENKNNTHYAITKHHSEMHVWRAFAEGLSGVIINPSTILGFGDWHQSSCAIFRNAYNEFGWYTNGVNGFVGVEDVAEAAVRLLQSSIVQSRFIVNAENISFRHLFNLIAESFNKQKPTKEASRWMGELAWRAERIKEMFTGKPALLTKETAKVAHSRTEFDNQALLTELADFQYTPLKQVIAGACRCYVEALERGTLSL